MFEIYGLKENDYEDMEGDFFCECFKEKIKIIYDKSLSFDCICKSVDYFNLIYNDISNNLHQYTMDYCRDFMSEYPDIEYDKELYDLRNNSDILNFIQMDSLRIESINDNIAFNISGGCSWAEERGFQWIVQGHNILYVGPWYDLRSDSPRLKNSFSNYAVYRHR